MTRSTLWKGYLCAITSAVLYGCMPLLSKLIYADGINAVTLVLFRNLLALPLLGVLAFVGSKSLRLPKKVLPQISAIAVLGCIITPLLLLASYLFIDSGVATVFHFIYPAVVILLGVPLLKQPLSKNNLLCVLLCLVGVCLFYTPGSRLDWQGCVLALTSGVVCAVYICLLAAFSHKQIPIFLFTFCIALISSVVLLVFCLATGSLQFPTSARGWLLSVLFANMITVGAVALLQAGTFLIGGAGTSILSTLELITSVIIGVSFFREKLTVLTACGSILVARSSVFITISDIKNKKGV